VDRIAQFCRAAQFPRRPQRSIQRSDSNLVAERKDTMIDQEKLMSFMGKFVGDLGAVVHAPLVLVGARLGLYRALAEGGRQNADQLADRTGTYPRYVREWLAANAASGYAVYHAEDGTYELSAEQAFTLADPTSPAYLPGAFKIALSMYRDLDKLAEAYVSGRGVAWGEHDHSLFEGTEEFFRPGYQRDLVANWIPALEGVKEKLEAGGRIADVGCGHGASVFLLAQAFPRARIVGFDNHAPSIERARELAALARVADRVSFEVASAQDYPGKGFDLVAFFDCLHDMGDPAGAAAHVRGTLAPGGVLMVVEPQAGDRVEENLHPLGRVRYAISTLVCTPGSLSQPGRAGLGTLAGEARLSEAIRADGFAQVRRATETPLNMVLEAR
jgi:SAM-dependent methyltransferase